MKNQLKRFVLLLLVGGLLLTITGCFGTPVDEAKVKTAITAEVEAFRVAVEGYDIESMLRFLDSDSFKLTISEGAALSYDKDYATLRSELEEDEEKQLRWRQDPPDGYGYVLAMNLGPMTYTKIRENGAIGTVSFSILEEAEGISRVETDTGTIVVVMAKLQDQWLCQEMSINFAARSGQILTQAVYDGLIDVIARGFGFRGISFGN